MSQFLQVQKLYKSEILYRPRWAEKEPYNQVRLKDIRGLWVGTNQFLDRQLSEGLEDEV